VHGQARWQIDDTMLIYALYKKLNSILETLGIVPTALGILFEL
jgi:hypothetical protein